MPDTKTNITTVATVAVPSSDQDRAIDFYVNTLGFEIRVDAQFGPGQRWVEVAVGDSPVTIAIPPAPEGSAIGVDTGIRFTTTDAEADHADLSGKGVDVDPEVMRWPGVPPMFSFRDPDGNALYIVEQMGN